jgi:hypothetical protein
MGERGRDLGAVLVRGVRQLKPRNGLFGPPDRYVEKVTKVVRIGRILGRAVEGSLVGRDREPVVAQHRLRGSDHGPRSVVAGEGCKNPASVDGRSPGVTLDQELSQLTMSEDALLASGERGTREPVQHRKDIGRIEGALKRPLDVAS